MDTLSSERIFVVGVIGLLDGQLSLPVGLVWAGRWCWNIGDPENLLFYVINAQFVRICT